MNYSELIKEFSAMCKARGFSKSGKTFSRCIGDGIYQNISIAENSYLSPFCAEYSSTNKTSPCIKIGFWSMYSFLHPLYFIERKHIGNFHPENILGISIDRTPFNGLSAQYEIMTKTGFDLLDSMTTQNKLVDTIDMLMTAMHGAGLSHSTELAAPYYLCGDRTRALSVLRNLYAQNYITFHHKYDYLKQTKQYDEYITKEEELLYGMKEHTYFLKLIGGNRKEEITDYMLTCLNQNIQYAKENKIAFADNFAPSLKK